MSAREDASHFVCAKREPFVCHMKSFHVRRTAYRATGCINKSKNAALHPKGDAKVRRKSCRKKSIPEGGIEWYKRTTRWYKMGYKKDSAGIKARNAI